MKTNKLNNREIDAEDILDNLALNLDNDLVPAQGTFETSWINGVADDMEHKRGRKALEDLKLPKATAETVRPTVLDLTREHDRVRSQSDHATWVEIMRECYSQGLNVFTGEPLTGLALEKALATPDENDCEDYVARRHSQVDVKGENYDILLEAMKHFGEANLTD
jgi:hypothetical protein